VVPAQEATTGRKTTAVKFQFPPSNRHTCSTVSSSPPATSCIFYSLLALQVWGGVVNPWLSISEYEKDTTLQSFHRAVDLES